MKGSEFRRGYTREEIGRMTWMDFRIVGSERSPLAGGHAKSPRTTEEIDRYRAGLESNRNSWEFS